LNELVYTANRLTYDLTVIRDSLTTTGTTNHLPASSGLRIFPNPAIETVHLNQKTVFSVISSIGQPVIQSGVAADKFDVNDLCPGVYFLHAESGVRRFIKQ
jgi:hypothetical protein